MYGYSKVGTAQQTALDRINWVFEQVHGLIVEEVPEGRYRALALTSLEQASLWANKAIAKEWDTHEQKPVDGD
jgi:hypothetical protein